MLFEFLIALGGFIVTVIIADWRRNLAHNRRFDRMNERLDRINERFDRQNERFEEIVQLIFSEHGKLRDDWVKLHGVVVQQDSELRDFFIAENKEIRRDIREVDRRVAGQEGYLRAIWSGVYGDETKKTTKPIRTDSFAGVPVAQ